MKLKTGQKCAFGFGAFGKDIVYMLISSYLLYYYKCSAWDEQCVYWYGDDGGEGFSMHLMTR